ncbi:SMP-30/gluconolactonase/LRE family protein [Phenylobacterium deserti]|uniref:SMP-30/gluconolactonase/LRE family protein n=1 Tax=Phenylobacterium deserti TaxID=1914756 RepID=A0A328AS75_9CAUL|nr:SMP-30/gluconolactonase/LRE family protein [Phenylobacterium deserti]RAK57111.1 SMP-30/gluconolactonase/LRE family protein [Phenylobacterium deserti]
MGEIEFLDDEFAACVNTTARLERLYDGCRWAEGPAYFPAHRQLVWSDIPNNRLLRFDETTGQVSVFREPSDFTNGNTVDRQGRLVSCQHGGRRILRTEHDGSLTVLSDRFEGRRLNSPNDLVVRSDDSIWFTDPAYGIDSDYEGVRADPEQDGCHVYRLDPHTNVLSRVASDFVRPNGIAFSPDERRLFIADTGGTHRKDGPRHIRAFDVDGDRLTGGEVFAELKEGFFDGFRFDEAGRLWTSAHESVHVYAPDGRLLGRIRVGEMVANVCFGGPRGNRLYICATTSLYALLLPVRGAKTF